MLFSLFQIIMWFSKDSPCINGNNIHTHC